MLGSRKILTTLGLVLIVIFLSAFQSVFWYQVVGPLSPPLLWLCFVNFFILNRSAPQSLFLVYLLTLAASSQSAVGIGFLSLVMFFYFWVIVIIKDTLYIQSTSYFVLINFAGTCLFHVLYLLASYAVEENPTQILFFERMTQILLTPLFSIPLYWALEKWERWTQSSDSYLGEGRYES